MKYLILLAFLTSPAYAWDCTKWISTVPGTECYKPPAPASDSNSNSAAQANSKSVSAASAQSSSSSTAATSSVADASNAGVTTTYSERVDNPRQTPFAYAPSVQPTSSCLQAVNAGASSPVVALSFGTSHKDKQCDLRETARLMYEMGQERTAMTLLCKSDAAKVLAVCEYDPPKPLVLYDRDAERERRMKDRGFPGNK